MLNVQNARPVQCKTYFPDYTSKFERRYNFRVKFLVILFLSVSFLIYRFSFSIDFTRICIGDYLHEVLYPVNRWIDKDPFLMVILVGQVLMDGFICFLLLLWVLYMKNMDMPNFALVFYTIRALYLKALSFPFPDEMVWRSPPIPSIMVPYDRTRDFFFSGHTGLAIILTMEVIRFKCPKWVRYLAFWMIAWMPFMLITTRVHYTIDVLAAPLYVKLSYHIHERYKDTMDYAWSLPFIAVLRIRDCFCPVAKECEDNKLFDDTMS